MEELKNSAGVHKVKFWPQGTCQSVHWHGSKWVPFRCRQNITGCVTDEYNTAWPWRLRYCILHWM